MLFQNPPPLALLPWTFVGRWKIRQRSRESIDGSMDGWMDGWWKPILIVVLVLPRVGVLAALLSDGQLDALEGEALAQLGRLDHAGELLGRVDLDGLGEARGQDGDLAARDAGAVRVVADVEEGEVQAVAGD